MNRQKSFSDKKPALYLVATPIGNLAEFTPRAVETLQNVDVIAAEDTRVTMKLLSHFDIHTRLIAHHQHNEEASAKGLLQFLQNGKSVAVVSDAGYPLVSDPGQSVTELVINAGFPVIPVSGANAMLNALVASGLPAQPFLFYGFLKTQEKERTKELLEIKYYPQTLVFYEAPHRIKKMLSSMLETLGNRNICLARELTKVHEEFIRGTISEVVEICEELKGEMVIIVEGSKEEKQQDVTMLNIQDQINVYMEQGYSSKEAIKKVAKERGLAKNDIYKEFHNL